MRRCALLSLLLLAGCYAPGPDPVAQDTARTTWISCVFTEARDLGDATDEPADLIGVAAVAHCGHEEVAYWATIGRLDSLALRARQRQQVRDGATGLVIERRARRNRR